MQRMENPQPPIQDSPAAAVNTNAVTPQMELTNKILSLFGGSAGGGASVQGVPPANGTQQQQLQQQQQQQAMSKVPSGAPAPALQSQGQASSGASLINFDNPNVQKALDNLIQSTPNLLKNISANMPTQQMGQGNMPGGMGAANLSGMGVLFGRGLGILATQAQAMNNRGQGNIPAGFGGLQGSLGAQAQAAQGSQSVYSTGISGQGTAYAPNSQQRFN